MPRWSKSVICLIQTVWDVLFQVQFSLYSVAGLIHFISTENCSDADILFQHLICVRAHKTTIARADRWPVFLDDITVKIFSHGLFIHSLQLLVSNQ